MTAHERNDLMRQVGCDVDTGECGIEEYVALAEELTGVLVTPDMLKNGSYSTGIVEVPHPAHRQS